jgi:hypothetical protein
MWLVRGGYDGDLHGLFATVPDRLNKDLIEFI